MIVLHPHLFTFLWGGKHKWAKLLADLLVFVASSQISQPLKSKTSQTNKTEDLPLCYPSLTKIQFCLLKPVCVILNTLQRWQYEYQDANIQRHLHHAASRQHWVCAILVLQKGFTHYQRPSLRKNNWILKNRGHILIIVFYIKIDKILL